MGVMSSDVGTAALWFFARLVARLRKLDYQTDIPLWQSEYSSMLLLWRSALGLILALALYAPLAAESAEPLEWRPWSEWDNATKSFVPIDGSTERRADVQIAKAQLNPDLKEFLFIYRQSPGWCGSRGCSLEVLAPTALDGGYSPVGRGGYRYAHFGAWTVPAVAIDTSTRVNGWYGLVLSGNTWVFNGSQYVLP